MSAFACFFCVLFKAPTTSEKRFLFRKRTEIYKKLSREESEVNFIHFPLYRFIEMYHLSPKAPPAQPHIPTQLSDTYLHKRNRVRGPGPRWGR